MKITIVHNAIEDPDRPDEADVQVQVNAVFQALTEMGHKVETVSCALDLSGLKNSLHQQKPDMVFNLVESLDGQDRLIHLVPSVLDVLPIAYSGCSTTALFMTSNKLLAKSRLQAKRINTPQFISRPTILYDETEPTVPIRFKAVKWLVKSIWDHASYGLDEDLLLDAGTRTELEVLLEQKHRETGKEWFAEQYIDGREFNVSLLEKPDGPEVLPVAEIIFRDFPQNKPKIVGYRAKWKTDSFEYKHTIRSFDFSPTDAPLLEKLSQMALQCWYGFHLSGYARVDFRVNETGCPWVLEINANPCLSPDAGFPAALMRAGIGYVNGIGHILNAAVCRYPQKRTSSSDADRLPADAHAGPVPPAGIVFRYEVETKDIPVIEDMTRKTGFFREDEIKIAVELAQERLENGPGSGYHFVFAVREGKVVGYTCYGPIPCTLSSFDLYWIAVLPDYQTLGIGKLLLAETEKLVRRQNGLKIYIETSHKDQYASTRTFYTRCGYALTSLLEDFYGPGDGKATYCKTI